MNSRLTLCAKLDQPMTKSAIPSLVEIMIQIKVVQEIFHSFSQDIAVLESWSGFYQAESGSLLGENFLQPDYSFSSQLANLWSKEASG